MINYFLAAIAVLQVAAAVRFALGGDYQQAVASCCACLLNANFAVTWGRP